MTSKTLILLLGARLLKLRPRAVAPFAMLLFTTSCIPGQLAGPRPAAVLAPALAAPAVDLPEALVEVAPATAAAINAAIPVSNAPNPAARAFDLRSRSGADQSRSLECLTAAVYYEAASESDDGQRAVAQVVLNRLRHPGYPATVCGVVYQGPMRAGGGCQFTFTCDGAMARPPAAAAWRRARRVAAAALAGGVYAPVGHATHYHTHAVLPVWASRLTKSAEIGAHIFYRFGGAGGAPAAFRQTYRGAEPDPVLLARRSLAATPRLELRLASITTPAAAAVKAPANMLPKVAFVDDGLPESTIRDEYRHSGQPLPAMAEVGAAR